MTTKLWIITAAICVGGWVFLGLAWLLPKKWRLLKRLGYHVTTATLIKMAKDGDADAKWLKQRTSWHLIAGLLIILMLAINNP